MHDPNVPLHDRMYAADILYGLSTLGIYSDDLGEVTTYRIPPFHMPHVLQ